MFETNSKTPFTNVLLLSNTIEKIRQAQISKQFKV